MNNIRLECGLPWPLMLSVLLLVALAMCSDLRSRKIPNRLLLVALPLALLAQITQQGVIDGSLAWLGGLAVGMAVLLPGYVLRMMGAGDVKLMGAVGAFFCAGDALKISLLTCVFGGVMALLMMLRQRQLRGGLNNSRWVLFSMLQPQESAAIMRSQAPATVGRIPYAVPIALGTLCALWISL